MILLHMFIHVYHIWTGTKYRTPNGILLGFRVSTQIRTKLGILGCFTKWPPTWGWFLKSANGSIRYTPMNPNEWTNPEGIITSRYLLYVSVCCHPVSWPVMISVTLTAPAFVPSFQFTLFRKAAMCSDEPGRVSKCSAKARKAPAVTKVLTKQPTAGEMWLVRLIQNPSTDVLPEIGETK